MTIEPNHQDTQTTTDNNATATTPNTARQRSLIALDGSKLNPTLLNAALEQCAKLASRVDILLINSSKAPTYVLHKLLIGLERQGIDYRLTSGNGTLGDELTSHLRRFLGISLIMVTTLPALGVDWRAKASNLREQGYRLTTLIDQSNP